MTAEELTKLLQDTFADRENGRHCWCQLPSGNWFCAEPVVEGRRTILRCCIVDHVDLLGYPYGKFIADCGHVFESSECAEIADYAFKCDSAKPKTTYIVDVFRSLAQTIEVEAESVQEAEDKAAELTAAKYNWDLDMLSDDLETTAVGEVNEDGEREYWR